MIAFILDDKNAIYVNTRKNSSDTLVLAPTAEFSKNVLDWDTNGPVTFSAQEIATIDNQDSGNYYLSKILPVDQQSVGDILFRASAKAENVPGSPGSPNGDWGLVVDIRHHDGTWEYQKQLQFPTGQWSGWHQFALAVRSDAGKTIQWLYLYLMFRNRKGKVHFKFPEAIDLTNTTISATGEAYSRPECIYALAEPGAGLGQLKVDLTAFAYGDLANINLKDSPEHSIAKLQQFPYLICGEPGTLTTRELYVTDGVKNTVKLFGYVAMGSENSSPLPDMADLKLAVDRIANAGWYGAFLDRYGYDYLETRARQNEIVSYAHTKGLWAFANGWNTDDVLGSAVDATYNPSGTPTQLGAGDWVLLESFLTNNSGYTTDIYAAFEKYTKAKNYKTNLGVKIGCLSYKRNALPWDQVSIADARISYLLALLFGFDGWWYTDAIENDSFIHAQRPDLNVGNTLLSTFNQATPYWYLTETDKYLFVFSTQTYPPLTCNIYDKGTRRELPLTNNVLLYSADMATWSESPTDFKFVREKKVIIP